jgi:RNA polymerase sigma factor (sigma-70 family)
MMTREPMGRLEEREAFGDRDGNREAIVLANVRYAKVLAGQYPGEYEENLQLALLGLCEAVDRYDPGRGVRFYTYASHWMRLHLRKSSETVKRPDQVKSLWRRADLHRQRREQELGREFGLGDACVELGYTERQMRQVISVFEGEYSLDAADDRNTLTAGPSEVDLIREKIEKAIDELPERARECVRMHYGVMDVPEVYRFKAIGERWGVSRQRAEKVHKIALEALRQNPVIQQMMEELWPSAESAI